jgi:hypothetical protein
VRIPGANGQVGVPWPEYRYAFGYMHLVQLMSIEGIALREGQKGICWKVEIVVPKRISRGQGVESHTATQREHR